MIYVVHALATLKRAALILFLSLFGYTRIYTVNGDLY